MSPLIDCVFQLLIFFLLSSSFLTPMIQLSLPRASTQDPAATEEILVSVDAQGAFFLNAERIAAEDLHGRLRPLIARSRDKVVTFRGDAATRYEWFVKVLDAARAGGAVHVNVAHQPLP